MERKKIWQEEILPFWLEKRNSEFVWKQCYFGIPPSLRGKIWPLFIKNRLCVTKEYFDIFKSKGLSLEKTFQLRKESAELADKTNLSNSSFVSSKLSLDVSESKHNKESSITIIESDIGRTFPNICSVFKFNILINWKPHSAMRVRWAKEWSQFSQLLFLPGPMWAT